MITIPTLPPLPPHFAVWKDPTPTSSGLVREPDCGVFLAEQMRSYALAAYAAGWDAGIEEAAKVPRQYAEQLDAEGWGNRFPDELAGIFNASTNMTNNIRALKSDAKVAGS